MGDGGRDAAVVVGVDGSERNLAAVSWAVEEASRRRVDLVLVGVACTATTPPQPWTGDSTIQYSEQETERILARVRARLLGRWDRISTIVPVGVPSRELVASLRPGDLLVVGRRGVGPVERVVLGSTSIEAAGRSPVTTIIVPDDWDLRQPGDRSVVAGVDGTERDSAVLDLAFEAAAARGARLSVVGAWEAPPLHTLEDAELTRGTKEAQGRLVERLKPWTRRYDGVDVVCSAPAQEPSSALLHDADDAELVVVGRYAGVHSFTGFSGFSTCRRVLHHARCPVAVAPLRS